MLLKQSYSDLRAGVENKKKQQRDQNCRNGHQITTFIELKYFFIL